MCVGVLCADCVCPGSVATVVVCWSDVGLG